MQFYSLISLISVVEYAFNDGEHTFNVVEFTFHVVERRIYKLCIPIPLYLHSKYQSFVLFAVKDIHMIR